MALDEGVFVSFLDSVKRAYSKGISDSDLASGLGFGDCVTLASSDGDHSFFGSLRTELLYSALRHYLSKCLFLIGPISEIHV